MRKKFPQALRLSLLESGSLLRWKYIASVLTWPVIGLVLMGLLEVMTHRRIDDELAKGRQTVSQQALVLADTYAAQLA